MFKDILQEISDRTEGCLSVLIIGLDGIIVEKVRQENEEFANFEIIIAEYTSLLSRAKKVNDDTELGGLSEMTISNENGIFILRLIGEDYFLAMILSPVGNFGRGRYELRRAELLLENEFVI
ncbi:MAG: roadblock/LC7 domain-containing protein [Aridibacter sp.]|jgi:predicted regulator of Ras-like GTPase activity (Roadblock/LC7/MglB family)